MVADSVEFLRGDGLRGALRRRALLRRLPAQPRVQPAGARGRGAGGRDPPRAVRHERRHAAARGRARSCARSSTYFGGDVGVAVHLHDDAGTGVANALAGVRGGAIQVQGTINGYGERTGNCNLTTIIPNLTLKMGIETIPADRLERLTPVAHHVAELVNMALNPQARVRGRRRRSRTRPGCTSSAIAKRPDAYEHVPPDSVGNGTRFVVSELAGQVDARAQGEGARARARRPAAQRGRRHAQAAGARGLPLRGRRRVARAADAPGRPAGSRPGSRSSRSG